MYDVRLTNRKTMGASDRDPVPLAALFAEYNPADHELPLWFVPPEVRRDAWAMYEPIGPEDLA
jgi:hypothetical protein